MRQRSKSDGADDDRRTPWRTGSGEARGDVLRRRSEDSTAVSRCGSSWRSSARRLASMLRSWISSPNGCRTLGRVTVPQRSTSTSNSAAGASMGSRKFVRTGKPGAMSFLANGRFTCYSASVLRTSQQFSSNAMHLLPPVRESQKSSASSLASPWKAFLDPGHSLSNPLECRWLLPLAYHLERKGPVYTMRCVLAALFLHVSQNTDVVLQRHERSWAQARLLA